MGLVDGSQIALFGLSIFSLLTWLNANSGKSEFHTRLFAILALICVLILISLNLL